ncbi:hypothetical protein GF339_03425 [candidate division KSB3 bacterium]|uniref:Transglutaminase-like domain-containing protein n=1 Tax=candidate division KSB3 bacterium TaxID=2044937 RepID=A0A9D5Q4S9_9BACT|nr:hypothetical protein [candidate division KSB3 bacterium]MBD3323608.1 hypothetical protein [candidate division KSB3 bacterium]
MRICRLVWERTATLPFWLRWLLKAIVFGGVLVLVLFPHPVLFGRQVQHYLDMEMLIQPDFAGIEAINREIDALVTDDMSAEQEFFMIQQYVYQQIRYAYDWDNWGNIDFWPTAEQVWKRKREDCDGRAILAVSILRSRGFAAASLVGNFRHIWVKVGPQELMSPDTEQTIRTEGEKTILSLPSFDLLLGSTALYIVEFPIVRHLVLFFTSLVLCYHPCKHLTGFLGLTTVGLVGVLLLKEGAQDLLTASTTISLNLHFLSGWGLLSLVFVLALAAGKMPLCRMQKRIFRNQDSE